MKPDPAIQAKARREAEEADAALHAAILAVPLETGVPGTARGIVNADPDYCGEDDTQWP